MNNLKVAVIHDWFLVKGGAEQVFKQIHQLFPQADLFALFDDLSANLRKEITGDKPVKVSFLQKISLVRKNHRYFFPLYKMAIESLDISKYDLIISSSHAVAKGVRTSPGQIHICYCHTPVRYAWDLRNQYLGEIGNWGIRLLAKFQLNRLKRWDFESSGRVTNFVANSHYVSNRIHKNYHRESRVVYPPVDTGFFTPNGTAVQDREHYIVVSRMVPYKRIDLIIRVFNQLPHLRLKVLGNGPQNAYLRSISGPNIRFMGFCTNDVVKQEMRKARALVLAANEDFGITSLEAQSCGVPVIALRQGGYIETVIDEVTGIFFGEQSVQSLASAVKNFEEIRHNFKPEVLRNNALRFSNERFRNEFSEFVESSLNKKDIEVGITPG